MDFTIDLTDLLNAIITTLFSLIVFALKKYVVPYIKEKGLEKYAKALVKVAYTLYGEGCDKEKFDYVFEQLKKTKWAKYFDADRIKATIQAAYVEFCLEMGLDPSAAHKESLTAGGEKNDV